MSEDDLDQIPELAPEQMARMRPAREVMSKAAFESLGRGRGRPRKDSPKVQVSIRLDRDVLDAFRATGEGWQGRVNRALRERLGDLPA